MAVARTRTHEACACFCALVSASATTYGTTGRRRPALALDTRGFGRPQFQFLAFPAEEPPSIECNEDAGRESVDN